MKTVVSPITSIGSTPAISAHGLPLLRLGFRPFYLAASMFACLAIPAWAAMQVGWLHPKLVMTPMLWHAHEMLFGFAAAIIIGFLLTASKAWTGLATPRGSFLAALFALWLGARVAAVVGPYPFYAVLDLVLLPLVAAILLDVLVRARNRRSLPLVGMLLLMALANLMFHLSVVGAIELPALRTLYAGLALIVMIECVMAGRVVPAFTVGATPNLKLKASPLVGAITMALTAFALALWVFAWHGPLAAIVFAAAAALHVYRLLSWSPWVTRGRPLLWILHAAYAWIPVGFVLLALAQTGCIGESMGVHALTAGATGGLIIGMITRTAKGHTGRPLQASRLDVLAYALILLAAVLRVSLPLLPAGLYAMSLTSAALAWSAAFAVYLFGYAPWLLSTRLDGRDG